MPVARPHEPEPLPPPSAELVLLVTLVEAFLAELPRKRRVPYLARVTEGLELRASGANVHRIRPAAMDADLKRVSKEANAFWRQMLGPLMSQMAGLEK